LRGLSRAGSISPCPAASSSVIRRATKKSPSEFAPPWNSAARAAGFPAATFPRGANFQAAIVRAIRSARAMVLVFSANARRSDEIKTELALASQTKLAIIPVRIEDVAPDEAFAYVFAIRQYIDAFADLERALDRVAGELAQIAGPSGEPALPPAESAAPHPPRPAPRPAPVRRSRLPLVAGFAAVALIAAGGAWWMVQGRGMFAPPEKTPAAER